jgi:hypothetical protein
MFGLVISCGGGEFTSMTGGQSGSLGAGGASGAAGGSDPSSATSGTAGGVSTVGAGGAAGASFDAASGPGGAGGQPTVDATAINDATAHTDAAREAAADGGPRDAAVSDAAVTTKCPPSEPNVNLPCADGLDCTYGTHPRPACRREYVCTSSHWTLSPALACPVLGDCLNEMGVQVGASCSTPQHECLYSMGLYCRCLPAPDGGGAAWDCYPPPQGCPVSPPNKGQACDLSFMACAYGTCPLGTKVSTSCSGAIVRWSIPACPIP